ncbi:hypothetical protein ENHYDAX1_50012 [Enhydrobacter sp. AX1]|nr:hypothetical protein ENHYDAX1_50012 [Enhydrobacter sp. AX1]
MTKIGAICPCFFVEIEVSKKPAFYKHLDHYHFYKYLINFLSVLFSPHSVLIPVSTVSVV